MALINRNLVNWILLAAIVIVGGLAIVWFNRTPQIGTDDATFKTVDALFTAITSNRTDLVDASAARLKDLAAQGKLPDGAANELNSIIDQAKSGEWQPAAKRLYSFMQAQHRNEPRESASAPPADRKSNMKTETATLGGGCYWCLEAVFEQLKGVEKVVSGFSGGKGPTTYKDVCSGTTGHAEVIQITFDPKVISYHDLLEVFFAIHDPTTLNRQGNDVGTQYRSAIFYHSDEQKKTAEEVMKAVKDEGIWTAKVVTEVVPFKEFFAAEDYHQGYFRSNPNQGYCQAVVGPKVAKFRKKFADKLK